MATVPIKQRRIRQRRKRLRPDPIIWDSFPFCLHYIRVNPKRCLELCLEPYIL